MAPVLLGFACAFGVLVAGDLAGCLLERALRELNWVGTPSEGRACAAH